MKWTELLKELRGGKRSQAEWAEELGVSQQTISFWEAGRIPHGSYLIRLLNHYPERTDDILAAISAAQQEPVKPTEQRTAT